MEAADFFEALVVAALITHAAVVLQSETPCSLNGLAHVITVLQSYLGGPSVQAIPVDHRLEVI
jgi:hypothetical protein